MEIEGGTFGNTPHSGVTGPSSVDRRATTDIQGADHAFLWKTEAADPDIYEDAREPAEHSPLPACMRVLLRRGSDLFRDPSASSAARRIKGLRPPRTFYFIHPTHMHRRSTRPSSKGNALNSARGSGAGEYLAMREGIPSAQRTHRDLLNDLGAVGGFLFDVGSGRYPPQGDDEVARATWQADLAKVRTDCKGEEADRVGSRQRSNPYGGPRVAAGPRLALGFDV